ncbi:MAG: TIGR04190 family B12-binding domain/radical SAM domain protein [Anaerolineales bacterium]|nr:MAG: TIGR04190 family B12-binding domain/radical SAM domain protein [Anaerolineales bacterium]
MPEPDLVLLHAPSVYDFRQETILYGPIADFAPAPFVLEICPLGYGSLADYLEYSGYSTCILNLAKHMLNDAQFDAEQAIAALNPIAFGIDFHWLSHAQGALAVAQVVKTVHPETPVILGGFAATYYQRELIDYPQVDFVLRGDSTEEPLLHLMECLSLKRIPDLVPGLTWHTQSGHVIENPLKPQPDSLDNPFYGGRSSLDFQKDYPVVVGLMSRGCTRNCLICGGSSYAYQKVHARQAPSRRSPESLARELHAIHRCHDGSVYVPCDITQHGMDYAYRFMQAMRGFPNLLCLDLFRPVPCKFLKDMAEAIPHFALQICMDSHDDRIRRAVGKCYSNQSVEQMIADVLALGCERLDLHFTIGLPYQDYDSVLATVAYCDHLLTHFGGDGRLQPFIAPIIPFLDPGSIAFEEPGQHGYRLRFHTLEEHRRALLSPTWKHVLNYETEWMTVDDIVRATYDATVAMARLRAKHGLIQDDHADALEAQTQQARRLMAEIELALAMDHIDELQATLGRLKPEIDEVNQAGPWNDYWVVPKGKYARRPENSQFKGALASTGKVWRLFGNWWRHRTHSSRKIAGTLK